MERRTILNEAYNTPWTSSPIIPIGTISIELKFPAEMPQSTPENFQDGNFSIRGYAAEIKRRNPKASDPFQFDVVPSETTQGPSQPSNEMEKVPDADHNIADAADPEIEQLEPSSSATNTDIDDNDNNGDSDYKPSDSSDSDTTSQEDTNDEFDDLIPLSQLRKAVTHRLPNILFEENTNPLDNGQRVVETTIISQNLGHNTHEVDVAPIEVENMNNTMSSRDRKEHNHHFENVNTAMSDSEDSLEEVPQKLQMMSDILRVEGTRNYNHVQEGDLYTNDLVTNGDVEPTTERSKISSSGFQDNAPTDAGLQIGKKTHSLKRGAEGSHSLVTKKAKLFQIPETFPIIKISERKSSSVRSGDLKRCSMFNSVGSSSSAPIPNFITMNGESSRTCLSTLDGRHSGTGTTNNQDGGETSSFQRRTNLCLAESIIPPASAQDLLKKRQVLELKETNVPSSSYAHPKGSFLKPKERDNFQQKILENQGTLKSSIQTCERMHDKAVVQSSSDDFPLDILELMSRNQIERTCGINAESHLVPPRPPINTTRSVPGGQHSAAASYVIRPVSQRSVVLERPSLFCSTVFPFGPDGLQKFSAQSLASSCDKEKAISDIKAGELKTANEDSLFSPISGAFHLNHEFKELYSEDYILAMQLLSLKYERPTGSKFDVGTNTLLDNPLGDQ